MEITINGITYPENTPLFILDENYRNFTPSSLNVVAVEGDNNSSTILLQTPRYYRDIDLSTIPVSVYWKTKWLDDEDKPSIGSKALTDFIVEEDKIYFAWILTIDQTYKSDFVDFGLRWENKWTLDTRTCPFKVQRFFDSEEGYIAPSVAENLQRQIDEEIINRTEADKNLQEQITTNANAIEQNEQNIVNETTERKTEDGKLSEAINAEKSSREESDNLLDGKITNLNNSLQVEITNRENADSSLSERIDTNAKAITQEITDRKASDENLAQQIANITAVQIRNKSEAINSTEANVQTVATQYMVDNYQRQPQNFDGLIITVTDKNNDKILYIYSEVSKLWINSGINDVDLSNYYTKGEVDNKIDTLNKQIVSFDIYSSKTEFTTVDVLIPNKETI